LRNGKPVSYDRKPVTQISTPSERLDELFRGGLPDVVVGRPRRAHDPAPAHQDEVVASTDANADLEP